MYRNRRHNRGQRGIVFILRHFTVGGLERVVLSQIRLLLDSDFDVTVAVLHPGRDNALVAELDPRATLVEVPRGAIARAILVDRLVRDAVVLLHFGDGRLFPTLRPGLTRARAVIRFCHSDYSHLRNWLKNRTDQLLSAAEDTVVAVGGRSTRFILEEVGVRPEKVITLPNAIAPASRLDDGREPSSRVSGCGEGPANSAVLIAVASLYPHKGHDALLRGFARLVEVRPNTTLALVGDGSESIGLWRLARELGILNNLRWFGAVWNRVIVDGLLRQADLFVSMSRFEGIPISVLEARRQGLRMVLSDIPGHRDGAGPHATYVPVDDSDAFALAVANELASNVRGSARRYAGEGDDGDWDDYARRLLALVERWHASGRDRRSVEPVDAYRPPRS